MSVFGFDSSSWSSDRVRVEVVAGELFCGGGSERIFRGSSRGLDGTDEGCISVGILSLLRISSSLEVEIGLSMSLFSFAILLFDTF